MIPQYFGAFKGKSLDSYEFKATVLEFFKPDPQASNLLSILDWDVWFYTPGMPPKPHFDTTLIDVVYGLSRKWQNMPEISFKPHRSDVQDLTGKEIVVFLEQILLFEHTLSAASSKLMGEVYGFAKSQNVEVAYLYFQVGLKAGDDSVVEPATALLGRVGRMKFVRPL